MLALAKQVVLTNTKNKVQLNAMLAERNCPIPDTVIYDVSVLLWVIPWPTDKLSVYVNNFKQHQGLYKDA